MLLVPDGPVGSLEWTSHVKLLDKPCSVTMLCALCSFLFNLCSMLVPTSSKDFQLEEIVDRTIRSMDKNHDGLISFEEFCQIVEYTKVDKRKLSTNNSEISL